jgi:hypothetical protein
MGLGCECARGDDWGRQKRTPIFNGCCAGLRFKPKRPLTKAKAFTGRSRSLQGSDGMPIKKIFSQIQCTNKTFAKETLERLYYRRRSRLWLRGWSVLSVVGWFLLVHSDFRFRAVSVGRG